MPKLKRLSLKQKKFINNYLKTGNAPEAALEAYDTKNRPSAQALGAQTLDLPEVQSEIDKALEKNGITLDKVTDRVQQMASWSPDKVSSDTVLKANIELLKLLKAYPDKVQKHDTRSIKINLNSKDFKELIQLHKDKSSEIEDILNS